MIARIRAVLRRAQGGPAASRVIRAGELMVDVDAHRVEVRGQEVHLTPTEFGLLQALAEHRGHALTRLEMIERGLGYSYEGIERAVDSHIRNLRRKLSDAGAPADLVETVFGVGYRMYEAAAAKIETLEIAIADTGEGIAPEDLPHVFERFWRADPARTRSGIGAEERLAGGTGLGLSVAQSLVKAQGGRIWVESTPGEGTVFRFTLPFVQHDHA